jgi:lysozyme
MDKTILKDMLIRHEGLRLFPYRCTAGKLTVGVGRNIEQVGISIDEAHYLLDNDIDLVIKNCQKLKFWKNLDVVRKLVIADMVFNLGLRGFSTFRRLNSALQVSDYKNAAQEMRGSKWFHQVGQRAIVLANMMESGETNRT